MVTQEQKAELWRLIKVQHPDFGLSLQNGNKDAADFVSIDRYAPATNRWLMEALEARRPILAKHIKEVLIPNRAAMRKFFNASVTVPVDELIEVLVEYEVKGEPN